MFDWQSIGINTHGRNRGQVKSTCPECSRDRKKSREKCLSVNLDEGVYQCHNCDWKGRADQLEAYQPRKWERPARTYAKPNYAIQAIEPPDKTLAWFASRGIPAEVVKRHKIERRSAWMPQTEKDEPCIAFPYFRDGEIINVKYRTADKQFRMEKDAELCLYGLDDIEDNETLIWVEGELDKLACEVAGFANCVSVPNGAGTNLDCLANDEARLEHIKRHIIAVDNDEPGKKLEAALISRLGRDKCCVVEWPFGVKDANETLLDHGIDALTKAIERAKPIPIEGMFEIEDVRERVHNLYEYGAPTGVDPGWNNLQEFYRPRLGAWTAVISIPKSGKTAWLAALMVNLARMHGWKFAVFPAENLPPEEYISMLAEIYTGQPFNPGPNRRMDKATLDEALNWLQEHFVIISPEEDECDLDQLLAMAKSYCLRRGIQGLVIDPWNEIEHKQPHGMTETQYIAQSLRKVRRFAQTQNIHVWLVVHPRIMQKDKDGKYPVPTLYDASGSAHWRNKCDYGIAIYRHFDNDDAPTEIHVQAVRWKWTGKLGMAKLYFDRISGRYSAEPGRWRIPETRKAAGSRAEWEQEYDEQEVY